MAVMAGPTYDRMAPFYERLTNAYSLGCIPRARQEQLTRILPGMRVLYVGIGPGSDALAAAERGASVAGVDLSTKMVEIASRRFAAAGQVADLQAVDLFAYEPDDPYDAVVANFLLDCFDDGARPRVIERMWGFLRQGGTMLITDTGKPHGSFPARACWRIYHGVAFTTTWIQGITPWLPIMDLANDLVNAGFRVDDHLFHRPTRRGPVLFESVVGVKP